MSYSHLVKVYDPLGRVVFGGALERSGDHFLSEFKDLSHILIIGGGTGRILLSLEEIHFSGKVTYVDSSIGMINKARERVVSYPIEFINQRLEEVKLVETYDAVHMAFFLDQFSEVKILQLVKQLSEALSPDSKWVIADFVPSSKRRHRALYQVMYAFFGLLTGIEARRLPNIFGVLEAVGMKPVKSLSFYNSVIKCTLYHQ